MNSMMKNLTTYGLLAVIVPLLSGCGGGGASLLGLGSLFGFLGGGGGDFGKSFTDPDLLANIGTNPEPATMLLMGGGVATMAYFKAKKK